MNCRIPARDVRLIFVRREFEKRVSVLKPNFKYNAIIFRIFLLSRERKLTGQLQKISSAELTSLNGCKHLMFKA
jgi:hypothetical protein